MLNRIKFVVHVIWAIFAIAFATGVGAAYGWQHHGVIGAIALGFVGLCVGGLVAVSPRFLLEMLH
jgi:hypothetical protein